MLKANGVLKAKNILDATIDAGFDLCGIARVEKLSDAQTRFTSWLDNGYGEGLEYLYRNEDMRFDPKLIVEGAKSVVVCAVNYKNSSSLGYVDDFEPKIASYAHNIDYHKTIKNMLFDVAKRLGLSEKGVAFRVFVDSAPIAEKMWAVKAGLGWIGRNSLLITPQFGSFVLLGELVIAEEVDCYSEPFSEVFCDTCGLCLLRCPNGAILSGGGIDTRRCISRLTIEKGAKSGADLHGWYFGCDVCQSVCPHNQKTPLAKNPLFMPIFDPKELKPNFWETTPEKELDHKIGKTPITRKR